MSTAKSRSDPNTTAAVIRVFVGFFQSPLSPCAKRANPKHPAKVIIARMIVRVLMLSHNFRDGGEFKLRMPVGHALDRTLENITKGPVDCGQEPPVIFSGLDYSASITLL